MKAVLFLALFVVACSATVFKVHDTAVGLQLGQESQWILISAMDNVPLPTTITIAYPYGNVDNAVITFNSTYTTGTFRVTATSAGSANLAFSFTGQGASTASMSSNVYVMSSSRNINLDFNSAVSLTAAQWSEPLQVVLTMPSADALTLVPVITSMNNAIITVSPNPIVVPAGALAATFRIRSDMAMTSANVVLNATGVEAYMYSNPNSVTVSCSTRSIVAPNLPAYYVPNTASTPLYMQVPSDIINGTLYVQPTAANTLFNPATLAFTPGHNTVSFTMQTANVLMTNVGGDHNQNPVTYTVTGDNAVNYQLIQSGQAAYSSNPVRQVMISYPYSFVYNRPTAISVTITAPVSQSLRLTFTAGNMVLSPSSITFTGAQTSAIITATPQAVGQDQINVFMDGADQVYFTQPSGSGAVTVQPGTFVSSTYTPSFYTAIASPSMTLRVTTPPRSGVTVTPVAANMVFTPSSMNFNANTLQNTFQVRSIATNNGASTSSSDSETISFLVSGAEAASFTAPTAVSAPVNRRVIQYAWAPQYGFSSSATMYLGKQYVFSLSVSHASTVSVTPVNPYLSFTPATVNFNAGQTHVQVVATVIAVSSGSSHIDFQIGGQDGGLFAAINDQTITTSWRSFYLCALSFALDGRVAPTYVTSSTVPSSSLVSLANQYHVYNYSMCTNTMPDSQVSIQMNNLHVSSSNNKVTIKGDDNHLITFGDIMTYNVVNTPYVVPSAFQAANWIVDSAANGYHEIVFTLSGNEAAYYATPSNLVLTQKKVYYAPNEPQIAAYITSAASPLLHTLPFAALAATILLALF